MKALYVSASGEFGGGNASLATLIAGLRPHGVSAVATFPRQGVAITRIAELDVPCQILQYDWLSQLRILRGFREGGEWLKLVRKVKPDIIHVNAAEHSRAVSLAAWSSGVPWICHCRSRLKAALIRWVFRRLPKPSAVVFNSRALQAQVGATFEQACPRSPQVVVHNGVPLDELFPAERKESPVRRVGIVANLQPVKGYLDFIEMAATVAASRADVEFVSVGEDIHHCGYRELLSKTAKERGLGNRLTFLGHRRDVPDVLRTLDILVCPSHEESFGRCIVEAMGCGLPVVATAVGGIPEVVDDGVTGVLVPPRRPDLLAARVSELLDDEGRRAAMGAAGRKRAREMFSSENHATQILGLYRSVIGLRTT